MDEPLPAWSVKRVPLDAREMMNEAARRAGMPVGDWLQEAARAYIASEREPVGQVIPPGVPSSRQSDPAPSLEVVVQLAAVLPRLTETPGCKRLAAATRGVIESHLRGLTVGPTGLTQRLTGPG